MSRITASYLLIWAFCFLMTSNRVVGQLDRPEYPGPFGEGAIKLERYVDGNPGEYCFSAQTVDAPGTDDPPEDVQLARVARLVQFDVFLDELATTQMQDDLALVDLQRETIAVWRTLINLHVERVMVPRAEIVDAQLYESHWREAMKAIDHSVVEINELLLPHQKTRFYQIRTQRRAGTDVSVAGLLDESIANELKLTQEQQRAIEQIARAYREQVSDERDKYRMMVAELVEQMSREALRLLTREQRQQYSELVGPPIRVD